MLYSLITELRVAQAKCGECLWEIVKGHISCYPVCNLMAKGHLIETRRTRIYNDARNNTFSQNTLTAVSKWKREAVFYLLFNTIYSVKLLLDIETMYRLILKGCIKTCNCV